MADHEWEVSAEVGVPMLAKLGARYKRSRSARAQEYLANAASEAGLAPAQFEAACEGSEVLTDLIVQGGERASQTSDAAYRNTLSAIIAAAFADEALLDEVALLHSQLTKLEPAHLRVLWALSRSTGDPQMEDEQPGVRDLGRNVSDFTHLHATGLSSKAAVVGALEALRAVGMADRSMLTPNGDGTISFHNEADESPWSVTAWGVRALDFARQL